MHGKLYCSQATVVAQLFTYPFPQLSHHQCQITPSGHLLLCSNKIFMLLHVLTHTCESIAVLYRQHSPRVMHDFYRRSSLGFCKHFKGLRIKMCGLKLWILSQTLQASSYSREPQLKQTEGAQGYHGFGLAFDMASCQEVSLNRNILLLHFGWGESEIQYSRHPRISNAFALTHRFGCLLSYTWSRSSTSCRLCSSRPSSPAVLRLSFTQRSLPPFIRHTKTCLTPPEIYSITSVSKSRLFLYPAGTALSQGSSNTHVVANWCFWGLLSSQSRLTCQVMTFSCVHGVQKGFIIFYWL